jgi:magnesium transporter
MQITIFDGDGSRQAQPADLPALLDRGEGTFWVDMTGPTDEDLRVMHEVFHFHPLAIEDTHNEKQRPKVEEYAGHLFLILNAGSSGEDNLEFRELDAFVGPRYLVTVHLATEPTIDRVRERLEHHDAVLPMSASYLLYVLVDTVVDDYFPILDAIDGQLEALEDAILTEPHPETLRRLSKLKRMLADMWRVIWSQRDALATLTRHDLPLIDQDMMLQYHLRDVADHLFWLADMVNTFRDTMTGLMDLHMSAISNRLNQVVNRLTAFAVVAGLLTVLSGFYGMNFAQTWPPFSSTWGVPFIIGVMVLITGAVLFGLHKLGWY